MQIIWKPTTRYVRVGRHLVKIETYPDLGRASTPAVQAILVGLVILGAIAWATVG